MRKALGATPWSIVSLILQEAVFITSRSPATSAWCSAWWLLELDLGQLPENDFFLNPEVRPAGRRSTPPLLLVASPARSPGCFPARRAAAVRPIEALRDE